MTLAEQLGNVGSEVSRALRSQGKTQASVDLAIDRALELLDLTLSDPKLRGRRREVARIRETLVDAAAGGASYGSTLGALDSYLLPFAVAARTRA